MLAPLSTSKTVNFKGGCGSLTVVPLWWLVEEEHDPLCVVYLKLLLY